MIYLKCPKCGEESTITGKWNICLDEDVRDCSLCGYEAITPEFRDAYDNSLDEDRGFNFDPMEEYFNAN